MNGRIDSGGCIRFKRFVGEEKDLTSTGLKSIPIDTCTALVIVAVFRRRPMSFILPITLERGPLLDCQAIGLG